MPRNSATQLQLFIMNKDEFVLLQEQYQQSGKSLKEFLKDAGICYSKYNYWSKKCKSDDTLHELAPITFTESKEQSSSVSSFTGDLPSSATLLFPNGLRAHFGTGTEGMLMEVLKQSLVSHVLP